MTDTDLNSKATRLQEILNVSMPSIRVIVTPTSDSESLSILVFSSVHKKNLNWIKTYDGIPVEVSHAGRTLELKTEDIEFEKLQEENSKNPHILA